MFNWIDPDISWNVIICGVAFIALLVGLAIGYSRGHTVGAEEAELVATTLQQDPDAQYPIPSIDWNDEYSEQLIWDLHQFGQNYPGYAEMIGIVQYQEHLFVTYVIQPAGVPDVAERRVVHFRYDEEVGDFVYDGEWREYVNVQGERMKKSYNGIMPKEE